MSLFNNSNASQKMRIRRAVVANRFYTADPDRLRDEITRYCCAGTPLTPHPRIIIAPHAGYAFSGPVAGIGYASIDRSTEKVILLGPSHTKFFSGLSIAPVDAYETPLGRVKLHKEDVASLRKNAMVHAYEDAHAQEHCLEVQLPFLQVLLSSFTIIPVIVGTIDNYAEVAELFYSLIDTKTLIVISSDFSHYLTHKQAKLIDKRSIATITSETIDGFIEACGENPIRIAMHLGKKMGVKPQKLAMRNSYEVAPQYGDQNRVVGYAAIVYQSDLNNSDPEKTMTVSIAENLSCTELTQTDKQFMLSLARDALQSVVLGKKCITPSTIPFCAQELTGCFITLTKRGALRGCIGYIEGIKPLHQAIVDNTVNAAMRDYRFAKVTPAELDSIKIEISILTKPQPFTYNGSQDLLDKIEMHTDGIILHKGARQSTFLPQVWQQLPDKVLFLQQLALKAGLGKDDWKEAAYKKYQVIHFEEP